MDNLEKRADMETWGEENFRVQYRGIVQTLGQVHPRSKFIHGNEYSLGKSTDVIHNHLLEPVLGLRTLV